MQHLGNYEVAADILISSSMIHDCSFELGMIYVPAIPTFQSSGDSDTYRSYLDSYTPADASELAALKAHLKSQE